MRSKVGVVVGEGVGRRRGIQGCAKVFLLEARAVSNSLDGRIRTLIAVRLPLDGDHHGSVVSIVDLPTGLLSLLGSILVVRILNLVQHSQPLRLRDVRSSVLVAQCLPNLSKVLKQNISTSKNILSQIEFE